MEAIVAKLTYLHRKQLTQTLWTAFALVQHGILACRRLALLSDARDNAGLTLALIASRVPLLAVLPTQRAVYRARFLTVAAFQVLDFLYRVLELKGKKFPKRV
jgi:hypothetical protein